MEKIRISGITKKDSGLVIVSYNDNKEATLNTKWQAQQVDYLEKDVGIGGEVLVTIQQKGEYTNITNVDMTSAVKNNLYTSGVLQEVQQGERSNSGEKQKSVASERGNSIIAQCLTKIEFRNVANPPRVDILESYHWYLKELG